jgi:hypothetical protein
MNSTASIVLATSILLGSAPILLAQSGKHGNAKLSMGTVITAASKWEELKKSPMRQKLERIRLRRVKFQKMPMDKVLKTLRDQVKKDGGPTVNFFIQTPAAQRKRPVTMDLVNMPLVDVVRYVCMSSETIFKVEEHAVVIVPAPPGTKY